MTDVLARIRRLRALAADPGATEHERALAAEKARAAMARHAVTLDQLGETPARPSASPPAPPPPRQSTSVRVQFVVVNGAGYATNSTAGWGYVTTGFIW